METHAYERRPLRVVFQEHSRIKETYAGRMDTVALEAHDLVPQDIPSKTVLLFMHPIDGTQDLPMAPGFARTIVHVFSCNRRYARDKLKYANVILAGKSGDGSLPLLYQSRAEKSSTTQTPAGVEPDLVGAKLPKADSAMAEPTWGWMGCVKILCGRRPKLLFRWRVVTYLGHPTRITQEKKWHTAHSTSRVRSPWLPAATAASGWVLPKPSPPLEPMS